jgi:hypothetical protein
MILSALSSLVHELEGEADELSDYDMIVIKRTERSF